jgi:hypothetical protein
VGTYGLDDDYSRPAGSVDQVELLLLVPIISTSAHTRTDFHIPVGHEQADLNVDCTAEGPDQGAIRSRRKSFRTTSSQNARATSSESAPGSLF